jgi:antirestriction protein ArdC
MKTSELYQAVTNTIIRQLEEGSPPWIRPWKLGNPGAIMPVNAATGRQYSGINIPILWHAKEARGYKEPRWMTYKQALPLDAHVRKGETGTTVVFTKKLTVRDNKGDDTERRISMLRAYTVFNVEQIDGLPEKTLVLADGLILPNTDTTMQFIDATKADIRIGGDMAMYVPSHDFVALPPEQAFKSREHYLATALHELSHWSGHKTRLDRDLTGRFKTRSYAAEELVAELSAAFLCAHLGIQGALRHAEYIASWLELLKEDDRAIFTAASKASAAADYLRSFSETEQQEAA